MLITKKSHFSTALLKVRRAEEAGLVLIATADVFLMNVFTTSAALNVMHLVVLRAVPQAIHK